MKDELARSPQNFLQPPKAQVCGEAAVLSSSDELQTAFQSAGLQVTCS